MVSTEYLAGRRKWDRPQAIIFSDLKFRIVNGGYIPSEEAVEGQDFIILTDHNRAEISMPPLRIENRERMINGTSRGHHVADKFKFSTSWSNLPGRVARQKLVFDQVTGTQSVVANSDIYTADEASGFLDIQDWYESHPGTNFWVYFSYDQGPSTDMRQYQKEYNMFVTEFSPTLSKRGLYDMWSLNIGLEEV